MKKVFSKVFVVLFVSTVIFQAPLFAQVKTNFTTEVRPLGSMPTGLAQGEYDAERNKVDISVPKKTRGVERYNKLNIQGEVIPDSFLFYRNMLNQRQKAVYDVGYKTLMKNEGRVDLPVTLSKEEFYEVIEALQYDNPEAFWKATSPIKANHLAKVLFRKLSILQQGR